jgi:hypothetical protein
MVIPEKFKSKFEFLTKLTRTQKLSLLTFLFVLFVLPMSLIAALNPVIFNQRAANVMTPPGDISPTPTIIAVPPLPANPACPSPTPWKSIYYGNIYINNQLAPAGQNVWAVNPRGEIVGCQTSRDGGISPFMMAYGEDLGANPPYPGMREGEPVTFYINNSYATIIPSPALWTNDWNSHRVDFYINSNLPTIIPSGSITPTPTPSPLPTPTKVPTSTPTPTRTPTPTPTRVPTSTPTPTKPIPTFLPTPLPTPVPVMNQNPFIQTTSLPAAKWITDYKASVIGYDKDMNDTLTMQITGLPFGLSVAPCTSSKLVDRVQIACAIYGRPYTVGSSRVNITVRDNKGGTASSIINLTVNSPLPRIVLPWQTRL